MKSGRISERKKKMKEIEVFPFTTGKVPILYKTCFGQTKDKSGMFSKSEFLKYIINIRLVFQT